MSENTNFYNSDTSYFCQPGDLVFEFMGELAFYRIGLDTPTSFMNADAIVGTMKEVNWYISEYLS